MKKLWKNEEGVSPVIAVILMVAITVVLAAVLYVMVSGMIGSTETTPKGSLIAVEDQNTAGRYYVTFQGSIKNTNLEIRITDASSGQSVVMDEPTDGESVAVGAGLNLTYDDSNTNQKLDGADQLLVQNGDASDEITVVYKPTGEIVATETLT